MSLPMVVAKATFLNTAPILLGLNNLGGETFPLPPIVYFSSTVGLHRHIQMSRMVEATGRIWLLPVALCLEVCPWVLIGTTTTVNLGSHHHIVTHLPMLMDSLQLHLSMRVI